MKSFKFIDLFCGIGGFRIGFERNGFDCVWSCDIDDSCKEVYQNNFNEIPFNETQTYYELLDYVGSNIDFKKYFLFTEYPVTGVMYYTDPTYYWYKKNFLEIIEKVPKVRTFNCTDGGTLVDDKIIMSTLNDYLLISMQKGSFN